MKKSEWVQFSAVGLLILMIPISAIITATTPYVFNRELYMGAALVGLCTLLFFVHRKLYICVLGASLLLGLFSVVNYMYYVVGIEIAGVSIAIYLLPAVGLYYWVFEEGIQELLRTIAGKNTQQKAAQSKSQILLFKQRFEQLTDEEIQRKLNENLVPEARKALEQIVEERQ